MKTLLDKYHDTVVAYAYKILYIRCMYFKEKIKARKKYSHSFENADKNTPENWWNLIMYENIKEQLISISHTN